MNEKEFLAQLDLALTKLNKQERLDIQRDFEEYFINGRREGKTTSEIIEAFGPIDDLATELLSAYSEEDFVQDVTFTHEDTSAFNAVDIHVKSAKCIIVPSPDNEVHTHIQDNDEKTKVHLETVNNTLVIHVDREEGKFKLFGISFQIGIYSPATVTIQLPQKLYETLTVNNDNGRIEMSDMQGKMIDLESDNGRIVMNNLVASSLKAHTDNGRIVGDRVFTTSGNCGTDNGRIILTNSKANSWQLETDNGRIELTEITGDLKAKTDNGQIKLHQSDITNPIAFSTDNGSITITTNQLLTNATVTTKTDMGSVSIYNQKGKKILFGNGELPIQLVTDMGSIKMQLASEK